MTPTFVLGGAQTDFLRNWTREGATLADLIAEPVHAALADARRSEEHTSELQSQ